MIAADAFLLGTVLGGSLVLLALSPPRSARRQHRLTEGVPAVPVGYRIVKDPLLDQPFNRADHEDL